MWGLATSGISGRESCGDGAGAAPVNDNRMVINQKFLSVDGKA
mgnify:CR=1 FL=1